MTSTANKDCRHDSTNNTDITISSTQERQHLKHLQFRAKTHYFRTYLGAFVPTMASLTLLSLVATCVLVLVESANPCISKTGGTCRIFGCDKSRGEVFCSRQRDFKCVCLPGYCAADNGRCVKDPRVPDKCELATKSGCFSPVTGCPDKQDCYTRDGSCGCKEGHCVGDNDQCIESTAKWTCRTGTPGTCAYFACRESRGPTDCKFGVCVCQAGYCTDEHGSCVPAKSTMSNVTASVQLPSIEPIGDGRVAPSMAIFVMLAMVGGGIAVWVWRLRISSGCAAEPLLDESRAYEVQ